MKKYYLLWMVIFAFLQVNAQTYCTPTTGGTNSSFYLETASFSDQEALYYDAMSYQMYVDNSTTKVVTSYPGGNIKVHLELAGNGAKAVVWVDWNSNGDFNDFFEMPIDASTASIVDTDFFIPPSQAPGIYRMRVQTGSNLSTFPPNSCGPNTNNTGNFVDFSLKIEPAPTCYVPTAITASNITNAAATISWTAPATAPNNGYEYYYTSSTTVPDATTPVSGSSATTSVPINGLSAFTTYYVYVRSVCGTNKTAWSLRGIFKTKCNTITSMFEDFENSAAGTLYNLDCWDKIILGNGTQSITTTVGVNNSKGMYQYANGIANTVIAVLPAFSNINAGTHWLRFKAKVSSVTGTLDIGYVINDTDAASFVNIQSINMTNTTMNGYEYSVVVPNTVPANARLAIRNAGVTATNIYWDEVYWEPKPTCLAPSNVALSNITSASVDIAWMASPSAPGSGYDIYYSTSSTPPASTATPNVTGVMANSYTLQNLNSSTTYYIWVRARCSGTDQSAWSNIASVLTLCAPQTSLYENFETYNNGLITNAPCWGRLVTGSGTVSVDAYSGGYSGTKQVFQRPVTGSAMAILPEFSNINAGTHSLRFRAYCSANTGIIHIGYVTNPADINSFVLIQDLNITNTSYNPTTGSSLYSVAIPNTVPATARLAISTTFAEGGNVIYYYDDVTWEPTASLAVNEVTVKDGITVYPNPFTDVITISGDAHLQSVSVYDATGKMVKAIKSPEKTVSLHELTSGIYIIRLTMKDNTSKTIKAIKK